jgi:hypothetical protein
MKSPYAQTSSIPFTAFAYMSLLRNLVHVAHTASINITVLTDLSNDSKSDHGNSAFEIAADTVPDAVSAWGLSVRSRGSACLKISKR